MSIIKNPHPKTGVNEVSPDNRRLLAGAWSVTQDVVPVSKITTQNVGD
jgi:hypothetical protein